MKRLLLLATLLWPLAALADFQAGLEAYYRGDYAAALREWRPLAEAGNAEAQFHLALMYRNGEGVPKDDREAARWYRRAAEQGFVLAQIALGGMYDDGNGVPEDDREAARWYRKAAEQGDPFAQYNLGLIYVAKGAGVPEDVVQAYAWFNLAAAQGAAFAADRKDTVRSRMTWGQIAEAQKLSRELCAKIPGCAP
jgi:TPR repeat protein